MEYQGISGYVYSKYISYTPTREALVVKGLETGNSIFLPAAGYRDWNIVNRYYGVSVCAVTGY